MHYGLVSIRIESLNLNFNNIAVQLDLYNFQFFGEKLLNPGTSYLKNMNSSWSIHWFGNRWSAN